MQRDVPRTLEGEEGPPGPRGSSGGQGPQGIQGIQGIQGPTGTSGTGISSGTNGAVQFSDGAGGFLDNSNIYIIDNSSALLPHNAMVFDSSSDLTGRPVSSLVLTPPSGLMPNASYNIREGTMGYFQIDGTDKRDFYGYDPSGAGSPHYQWQSLTKLTTPADPSGGAIQFNEAGAFAASSKLRWSSPTAPYGDDALIIGGAINITDTSGGNTSIIQLRNAGGAGGIDIQSDLSCNITCLGHGNINLLTDNGDINCNITGSPGSMLFKNAQGPISLDAGMSIDLSANNFIQLKQNTSNIMYATQTNETFLTMREGDLSNNFGISLQTTGVSGEGVGLQAFIDVSDITVGQKGQATLQFNTDNDSGGSPYSLGALPRIFIQSSAKGSSQGGYRALFAAGATTGVIPLPTNIGDGDVLKSGEFYVGQARMTGGEHFCFNLDSGGFAQFNLAETDLCITDGSENKIFARLSEDSGGKLKLKNAAATLTTITLDGGNATIDCGASGGGIGIINVRNNAGTVLTKINGGDISANTVNSGTVTATTVTGDTLTDGAGTTITGGDIISKTATLSDHIRLTNPSTGLSTVFNIDPSGASAFSITTRPDSSGAEFGTKWHFPLPIGPTGNEEMGVRLGSSTGVWDGVSFGKVASGSNGGCSIILSNRGATTGGGSDGGNGGALYLGWPENTILNDAATWPELRNRQYPVTGFNPMNPCLLINGSTMLAQGSSSRIFSWDHNGGGTEEEVHIGFGTAGAGLDVHGSLTKTTGSFKIDHPDPKKTETHNLFHSFVESPTGGDNLYRYRVTTQDKKATITLPDYFKFLNVDEMTWVSPVNSFGRGYAVVHKDQTKVEVTVDADGEYNVLIIATRKDTCAVKAWKGVERKKKK